MSTASQKAMIAAADPAFQGRIKLALVEAALVALAAEDPATAAKAEEKAARTAFAQKVLRAEINLPAIALAVVVNDSIGASIAGAAEGDDTYGVGDDDIAFTVAEGGDPAIGVFDKMARANAGR